MTRSHTYKQLLAVALYSCYTVQNTVAQTNKATIDINTQLSQYATETSPGPLQTTLTENGQIPVEAYQTDTAQPAVYDFSYVSTDIYGRTQQGAFVNAGSTPVTIGIALIDSADYPVQPPANALFGQLFSGVYNHGGNALTAISPDDYDVIITYDTTAVPTGSSAQCVQYTGNDAAGNPIWSTTAIGTVSGPNANQITCQIINAGYVFTLQALQATTAPTSAAATTAAPATETPTTVLPTTQSPATTGVATTLIPVVPTILATTAVPTTAPGTTLSQTTSSATTSPLATTAVPTTVPGTTKSPSTNTTSNSSTSVTPGSPLTLPPIPANSQRIEFNLSNLTAQTVDTQNYQTFVTDLTNDLATTLGVSTARFEVEQALYDNSTGVIAVVVDILPGTTGSSKHFQLHAVKQLDATSVSLAEQLSNETSADLAGTTYLKYIIPTSLVSCNINNVCTPITPGKQLVPSTQPLTTTSTTSSPGFLDPSRYLWVPIVVSIVGVLLLIALCYWIRRRQVNDEVDEMIATQAIQQKTVPTYNDTASTTSFGAMKPRARQNSDSAEHYRFTDYKPAAAAVPINNTSSTAYTNHIGRTHTNSFSDDSTDDVLISYDTHTPTVTNVHEIAGTSSSPQRYVYAPDNV